MSHLLEVKDLEVKFALWSGELTAIDGISFTLDRGERLGIVGESGAGKSVTGFAIINMISRPGYISGGKILFENKELNRLPEEKMRTIRGNRISMIFQDPMTSLNPVMKIGKQITEVICYHLKASRKTAQKRAVTLLDLVGIPMAEQRANQYPHQLSGGLRQRVAIDIALACEPKILIADEPTTALDKESIKKLEDVIESHRAKGGMVVLSTHSDMNIKDQQILNVSDFSAARGYESASLLAEGI